MQPCGLREPCSLDEDNGSVLRCITCIFKLFFADIALGIEFGSHDDFDMREFYQV